MNRDDREALALAWCTYERGSVPSPDVWAAVRESWMKRADLWLVPLVADRLAALTQERDEFVAAAVARRNEAVAALAERDEARAVVEAVRALAEKLDAALMGYYGGLLPQGAHNAVAEVVTEIRALLPEPETSGAGS